MDSNIMEPRKILVPYDGSKQSDKALKKTIELAELIKKGGTKIEMPVAFSTGSMVISLLNLEHVQ
jgi:nucleotide-binding universal stress UspA family protein